MEHRDWFDGSDKRGEPVYFLPTNVKKAMSSAIPTEKQLNANLTHASNTRYSQLGNSAFVRQTQKQKRKKKCASGPGSYQPGASTHSSGYTYHQRQLDGGYRPSTSQDTCST
jgi:hypothetical protein